jgi:negative modulator of initiation of replication
MKTLAIEPDIASWLLDRVAESGKSVSDILREQLRLQPQPKRTTASASATAPVPTPVTTSPFDELFASSEFRYAKGVVGRFLVLLSWLYKKHPEQFGKVESIKGRGRRYFAKSAKELEDSGRSVNPKQIPASPYWVITTSPTDLKQQMVRAVMLALGYGDEDAGRAEAEIAGSVHYHLELWYLDGTILGEQNGTDPFPKWQQGQVVTSPMIKRPMIVREIIDSSNEQNGAVYFRRVVRLADQP